MERLTDHENEHYNQPGCNSCSDYRWRSCKESGEIDYCIQRLTWLRLLDIEDILGDDYDIDRLRELVEADKDGRCVLLPCKVGDFLYVPDINNMKVLKKEVRQVSFNHHGKWVVFVGCIVVDIEEIGKTLFFTREEAQAALERSKNND